MKTIEKLFEQFMKKPLQLRIQLISIVVLALFASLLILSSKADPDLPPLFALKRLQEKAFLKLSSKPEDKVDYMSSLLENRLAELQNVVKNKSYTYVLPAASRYSTLAGQITELVVSNNLTDKVNGIRDQFLDHQKILDALYVA